MKQAPILLLTAFAVCPAWAVPHLHPETYPNAKPCHVGTVSAAQIKRYGSLRAAVIGNATGTKRIAVIIVAFSGAGSSTSGSPGIVSLGNFDKYFNGTPGNPGMVDYYQEVSRGNMQLSFKFFGQNTSSPAGDPTAATAGAFVFDGSVPSRPNHPMEFYGCGDVDPGCFGAIFVTPVAPAGNGGAVLIHDALVAARVKTGGPTNGDSTLNSNFFDAVLVMHAGHGNETTSQNGDIWSAFYPEPDIIGADATTFTDGATFPELESVGPSPTIISPLGVMCHEFGHVLKLPDLYNTAVPGGVPVVGEWDLMDAGPFQGGGANPAHMGAWDRKTLGWETPVLLTSSGTFSIHRVISPPPPAPPPLPPPTLISLGGKGNEYFLVEYRSQAGTGIFDKFIPGTGVLVWHVDDTITNQRGFNGNNTVNTGSPHYGVSVVTADLATISRSNEGAASNLFPIGRPQFGSPQSNLFDGTPTGIIIANIKGVGADAVTFDAASFAGSSAISILKLVNYPNPAGSSRYPHPNGPGHTTIQFQLSKPANDYQINIYTLSGDLVRKIGKDDIGFQLLERSTDNKFVYEFVWDLKNGDGAMVAPGVYLYLVRADGATQSSKAVIIR